MTVSPGGVITGYTYIHIYIKCIHCTGYRGYIEDTGYREHTYTLLDK